MWRPWERPRMRRLRRHRQRRKQTLIALARSSKAALQRAMAVELRESLGATQAASCLIVRTSFLICWHVERLEFRRLQRQRQRKLHRSEERLSLLESVLVPVVVGSQKEVQALRKNLLRNSQVRLKGPCTARFSQASLSAMVVLLPLLALGTNPQ